MLSLMPAYVSLDLNINHSSYGDRCFAAASPRLWNSLPAHLRQTDINFE